jgi:hypothetical protein
VNQHTNSGHENKDQQFAWGLIEPGANRVAWIPRRPLRHQGRIQRVMQPAVAAIATGTGVAISFGTLAYTTSPFPALGLGGAITALTFRAVQLIENHLDGKRDQAMQLEFRSTMNDALARAEDRTISLRLPGGAHIEILPPVRPRPAKQRLQAALQPPNEHGR